MRDVMSELKTENCFCYFRLFRNPLLILSEEKPRLEFNYASGERISRPAKINMIDPGTVGVELERHQVQGIEYVIQVGADIESGDFAEKLRQADALDCAHIDGEVARTAKDIATDPGHIGRRRVDCGRDKSCRGARTECPAGPMKIFFAPVLLRAAPVSEGTLRTLKPVISHRTAIAGIKYRSPGTIVTNRPATMK